MRIIALITILASSLAFTSCASFRIPAPQGPAQPLSEPVVESSTITVPIALSTKSLLGRLDKELSRNNVLNKFNRENNITGKLQDLINSQGPPDDTDFINNIYLRLAIGKAWEALQNPIKLNYSLSLLLNPQAVQVSPLTRQGDTAKIVVGLVAKPKLVSGDLPKASAQALPNFSMIPASPTNEFHIMLENELSFDFIGDELTRRLEGKAYPVNGKNIVIKTVKLYGSGEAVIVEITVKGTVKGKIYLTGTPAYDEASTTLSVRNLDYTIETKNVLAKAADWMLHTGLRESLAEQATWSLGDKLDAVKNFLSDALNRKITNQVSIKGKIRSIRPAAVGITSTSVKAVLVADGTIEVTVF